MKSLWIGMIVCLCQYGVNAQHLKQDAILGYWKATEKMLTIEVYRHGNEYNARIISFTDHHSKVPSTEVRDEKNPNPALRSRKMIGINVLTRLVYDTAENQWTDGVIYNAKSGKNYSATVELENEHTLSVRAYKGISLLGKTMTFVR